MVFLILAATWRALPFVTLLILAALQTVPKEVTESAQIDGANGLRLAQYITIPLIMPSMIVALFNLILGGMNGVGMVFSLTGGGPGTTTYVLSYLLYTPWLGQARIWSGRSPGDFDRHHQLDSHSGSFADHPHQRKEPLRCSNLTNGHVRPGSTDW